MNPPIAPDSPRNPVIVQVPPPRRSETARHFCYLFAGLFGSAALMTALMTQFGERLFIFSFSAAAILLVISPLIMNAFRERTRKKFFAAYPDAVRNPLVRYLERSYTAAGATARLERLTRRRVPPIGGVEPAPLIVCLGGRELPTVGAVQFEPEIITPTRSVGRELRGLVVGGVLVTLFFLGRIYPLPIVSRLSGGSFAYFFVIAIGGAVIWLWRSVIRPRYIRLAPGMIQILEYGYRRQKPEIRSYPMTRGTVVCLWGDGDTPTIRLQRDGRSDVLTLAAMALPEEMRNRIWDAMLSSAPTPPLSEDGLVG